MDPEVTTLRQRLREFYLWNADQTRDWLVAVSYSDFNEMCMRLPKEELIRLVAVLCGENEDVKEAALAESLTHANIAPEHTFDGFQNNEFYTEELPDGWVETEYSIHTEMLHQELKDCSETKKHTLAHDTVTVATGDVVCAADATVEGQGLAGGEVALGKNLVVAYMPFHGTWV